jgi:hypothetical protein
MLVNPLINGIGIINPLISMGDLQDPKMEVLYHIRPYFGGISPYIALKFRP